MIVRNLKIIIPQTMWEIPPDPYIDYEASDRLWARPLGYGKEVQQPIAIEIPLAKYNPETNTYTAMIDDKNLLQELI